MDCSACGYRNPPNARFCGECGAPLGETIPCPACGESNPPGHGFCNACGEALPRSPDAPAPAATPPLPAPNGGRVPIAGYAAELRRTEGLSFSVRMGINSGEVVVGSIGEDLAMDYTAIGHTVGLAQRMEQLAELGTVYLTQHTAALVHGYFNLRDLGP